MEISLLADNLKAIDLVAKWYYEEWGSRTPDKTFEDVKENVSQATNRDIAPLNVLAKKNGEIIGVAGLKIREMEIYPEYQFWLGGVYVVKKMRHKGVASHLVKEIITRAKLSGITQLYLQTDRLDGGIYINHGFQPLFEVYNQGHQVLIMVANISS